MSFANPERLHDDFVDAFGSGSADALVDLYESDAVQLGPDGHVVTGHDQLRSVLEGLIASGVTLHGTQDKALVAGDLALTSTHYDVATTAADGTQSTLRVHTAEVSRRQADGGWLVVIDAPGFA